MAKRSSGFTIDLPKEVLDVVKSPPQTKDTQVQKPDLQTGILYEKSFRDYTVFKVIAMIDNKATEVQVSRSLPVGVTKLREGMKVSFTLHKGHKDRLEAVIRNVLATRTQFGKLLRDVAKPNEYGRMISVHEGKIKTIMGESDLLFDKLPKKVHSTDDYLQLVMDTINAHPDFAKYDGNLDFEATLMVNGQCYWVLYVVSDNTENTDDNGTGTNGRVTDNDRS